MTFASQLTEIQEIHELFTQIENKKIREALLYKLTSGLDELIHDSDRMYYDVTVSKKKNLIHNANHEKHVSVMNTMQTLNTFMPYMLMYNMLQSQCEDVE